jgi:hypothetical protein
VQRGAKAGLDFMHRAWLGLVADIITIQLQLIRSCAA